MSPDRFHTITDQYQAKRIAIVGDFSLDRYLEIDPARSETSIETGKEVFNVVRVRSQPGSAGTILNNVEALGAREIIAIGYYGNDGEGFELHRALEAKPTINLEHFHRSDTHPTFTYTKPLIVHSEKPPEELNRLDIKNWTPLPLSLTECIQESLQTILPEMDAVIVLDQVENPGTGIITASVLNSLYQCQRDAPNTPYLADSRHGLQAFPPFIFKMNLSELETMYGKSLQATSLDKIGRVAAQIAQRNKRRVFVSLAERGMLAASPEGSYEHQPAMPIRGEIDIVGAGDAVTANITLALTAGASEGEAIELASVAASKVIHQLGTTGSASIKDLQTQMAFATT